MSGYWYYLIMNKNQEKNTEENRNSTKNKRKKIWRRGNLSRKTRCSVSPVIGEV